MNAGLDFFFSSPQVLTNGQLSTFEGVATPSRNDGKLIAYSDGQFCWNHQHQLIATNLKGNNSSAQSALLVPKPGSQNLSVLVHHRCPLWWAGSRFPFIVIEWKPAPGSYTLTATPYDQSAGQGNSGSSIQVSFTVIETPPDLSVTDFTLFNALTDQDIGPLNHGDLVNLQSIGINKLNIRANTQGSVGSVKFGWNANPILRYETSRPLPWEAPPLEAAISN